MVENLHILKRVLFNNSQKCSQKLMGFLTLCVSACLTQLLGTTSTFFPSFVESLYRLAVIGLQLAPDLPLIGLVWPPMAQIRMTGPNWPPTGPRLAPYWPPIDP